jgi:hypothetical protein
MGAKMTSLKLALVSAVGLTLLIATHQASAYQLRSASNGPCAKDGSTCKVYCDNGQLAGTMNWNGSVWTDGVKWDPDMDAEARKICAANGRECT